MILHSASAEHLELEVNPSDKRCYYKLIELLEINPEHMVRCKIYVRFEREGLTDDSCYDNFDRERAADGSTESNLDLFRANDPESLTTRRGKT